MSSFPSTTPTLKNISTTRKKSSNTIFIVIIIILVVLLILIPIIVWFVARAGIKEGVGGACTEAKDCASGLTCNGSLCTIPDSLCPNPVKPMNIETNLALNGPVWTLTVDWDEDPNVDYYIIYIGEDEGFDPDVDPSFILITDTNSFLENEIPASITAYFRIRGVSRQCGVGPLSDEENFTSGPIL